MMDGLDQMPDDKSITSHHNNIQITLLQSKQGKQINPFSIIRSQPPNLLGNNIFVDDQFILKLNYNGQTNISIKRLSDLYPLKTPLFIDLKTGQELKNPTINKINFGIPTYLSELNMLPFQHFSNLIEPQFISQKGYYHVVMWKEGIMVKEIIDDTVYYDDKLNKIFAHPMLKDYPWIHILLKAWAKINNGYQLSQKCIGFQFLKTFSYPDWQYINPSLQRQQDLNRLFSKSTNKSQFMVCKTKNDPNVGLFGFSPNCASFIIRRHYQQYGEIFLIIQPFVHDHWNSQFSQKKSCFPEEMPMLHGNQFILPQIQFLNIFHLIYITNNKYTSDKASLHNYQMSSRISKISYDKYILNVDARDTKAIVLAFQILENGNGNKQVPMSINFYFPSLKIFDIVNQPRHGLHKPGDRVVPWTKVIIGQYLQSGNAEISYVESVKQKILDYGENLMGFLSSNLLYQFIAGQYFQGYGNQLTYNLFLKPGKYYIRLKIEQKQSQYRCHVNATAINGRVKLYDPKVSDHQQAIMLKDCLISKAKKQKKFITYINSQKKGSWIICRNQLDNLGYGYIVVQSVKKADNKIRILIDPKKVRDSGYRIKGNKQLNPSEIIVDIQENAVIILKNQKQSNSTDKIWPPPGIQFEKIPIKKEFL